MKEREYFLLLESSAFKSPIKEGLSVVDLPIVGNIIDKEKAAAAAPKMKAVQTDPHDNLSHFLHK